MAKPSWITVVSGSTGSGSGTRLLKASPHTGRISRVDSIEGVTSGGASDHVVLSQNGASEFITVDKTSYSVTALGGTVKITGTSNSPSLKLTNLTDSSLLSNFALKVNGTAYSWDGNSSHQISGDPGASSSYTFEISFDVAENQTERSKNITFRLTDSGGPGASSKTIDIIQAAGEKTYGTPNVNLRYYEWQIPASGGTISPSYTFSIPWGWNGKTSGGGTLTQEDTHTVTYAYVYGGPVSPFDWTLDPTTGVITMASLKTNQTTQDSGNIFIKITIEINGQTLEDDDYVYQYKNIATYTLSSASVSLDDIPASGGSADSPNFVSASGKIDYSSGESETPSITSSDVTITLSKTVNGSNLGSTIKARTKLETVTATINWNGSQVTQSIDVYQQANQVTYSSIHTTYTTVNSPGSGGEIDIAALVNPKQTATYTSGATKDVDSFGYNFRKKPSWITIDELTLKATVDKNVTGSTRDGVISITIIGMGNVFTIESISVHQEALVMPSWNLLPTFSFSGTEHGLNFNITDSGNVGWRLTFPDWCFLDPGITEGSGDHEIELVARANYTGSSRTGTVQLVSTDGNTVYATCTVTQKSVTLPTWDVPATFHFDSIGQSDLSPTGLDLNITNPDNSGWTIEGPSYVRESTPDGSPLPISGTGDKSLSLSPGVNTSSSERTFDLVLKASTGAVVATCNCSQDASESGVTWELPATLAFEGGGEDVVAFNITDKDSAGWRLILPDWCFVGDGITEGSGDHDTVLMARANDTGSSRTGTVQLVSTDGNTVFAICQVTQEEYLIIE